MCIPTLHSSKSRKPVWVFALIGLIASWIQPAFAQNVAPLEPSLKFVGTGSCAALACHGGRREPLDLKGSEYAFWSAYDPHKKAYGILFDKRSKVIEKNFRNLESLEVSAPERDATCLSCHVHPNFDAKSVDREEALVADGVGCESCHGPAERWLTAHTTFWFRGLSDREKHEQFGMTPTKDLTHRVEACATCHVGTPQADVNHDLIAAGHPRLLFEFANQQAKQPKHWRIEEDKARYPDYEIRAWALGQTVGTRSSLKLLASRAEASTVGREPGPWPEFAEYDCYSCHHDLKKPSHRQEFPREGVKPGTIAWGDWTLDGVRKLAEVRAPLPQNSKLAELQRLMATPNPKATEVASLAKAASTEIGPLIESIERQQFTLNEVDGLLSVFLRSTDKPQASEWTPAARGYLSFVALTRARGDLGGQGLDSGIVERLEALRGSLNVPIDQPEIGRLLDSPANYAPDKVSSELRSIREIIPH